LRCYGKFRGYGDGDMVRIRRWCHEGPWFFPHREDGGVKGFLKTKRDKKDRFLMGPIS
jgi:hypothetical protein